MYCPLVRHRSKTYQNKGQITLAFHLHSRANSHRPGKKLLLILLQLLHGSIFDAQNMTQRIAPKCSHTKVAGYSSALYMLVQSATTASNFFIMVNVPVQYMYSKDFFVKEYVHTYICKFM